jgi:hypothetical protein
MKGWAYYNYLVESSPWGGWERESPGYVGQAAEERLKAKG